MHVRLLLGSSLLAASLLLAGCNSGSPIDSRTGKPMMAGPWENRDLSLEYFQLDFSANTPSNMPLSMASISTAVTQAHRLTMCRW